MEFGMRYLVFNEVLWEVFKSLVCRNHHLIFGFRRIFYRRGQAYMQSSLMENELPLTFVSGLSTARRQKVDASEAMVACKSVCIPGTKDEIFGLSYHHHPWGPNSFFYGPEKRRRHDITLLTHSRIISNLQELLLIDGRHYYIYGDKAYMLSQWIQIAFDRITTTLDKAVLNTAISSVRIALEWSY